MIGNEATSYGADVVLEVGGDGLQVHHDAVITVDGGRITAITPAEQVGEGSEVRRVGGLLMPGLVNTHCHGPMVVFRSAGDGLPLDRWLHDVIWPREGRMHRDDVHAAMRLGSAEMLLAGVTTSVEMYLHDDAIIEAVQESGARLVSTPGIISALHGRDLPGRLREIEALHRRFHRPDERISIGFGPHSTYDLDSDMIRAIADSARSLDAVLHIHLEETAAERELVHARESKSATQLLADTGALGARVIAAHGIWLDADDRALLAQAAATVAHCPTSNLRLGSGFADVPALTSAGINVTIATDGPASAGSLDLWHGLRVAPGIARAMHGDARVLGVEETILMATANGGRAIGQADVGTLTVGSRADFIRVDLDHPVFSPVTDDHELLANVVFNNGTQHITDVWVDGIQLVEDRVCRTIDVEAAMADVAERAVRLLG